MLRAGLLLTLRCRPLRRLASLCIAGALLLPAGCQVTLPMKRLLLNGPPTPSPLSSGMTPPLRLTVPEEGEENAPGGIHETTASELIRTSYQARGQDPSQDPTTGQTLPAPDPVPSPLPGSLNASKQTLPAPEPFPIPLPGSLHAANVVAVNFDTMMWLTFERNADILAARERVHESEIALAAALSSCKPEALRKDIFKKPVAEATLWRRRGELRKVEYDNLQDAANTYFDWLTAVEGEAVARDLLEYEEKLLRRARKLAQTEKPVQVVVESIETAVNGRQQYILQVHQQSQGAGAKLAYLMGMKGGTLTTTESLQLLDRIDVSVPVAVFVRQATNNGPGVQELQGLIGSIQHGIDQARGAQRLCAHTGAALVCARLDMAQSQMGQAELSLLSLQLKLRATVEEAFAAILSGREQINRAANTINHAKETYRIMDLRLTEEGPEANMRNNTYEGVLGSIRQLSQTLGNYLTAVNNYNKAQARFLLAIGTYNDCRANAH